MGCCECKSSTKEEMTNQEKNASDQLTVSKTDASLQDQSMITQKFNKMFPSIKVSTRSSVKVIQGKIYDFYEIKEQLGEGAYGCVRRALHKQSGVERAIKSIMKTYVKISDAKNMLLEVDILRKLDHPNILKIIEVVQDLRYFHVVSEICTGGELFDRIVKAQRFNEQMAAHYMYQILSAVSYCHRHKVLHRDLKPENLLFQHEGEDSPLKVIDFGVSRLQTPTNPQQFQRYGLAYYTAPEALNREFTEKSDVWSCGIILYVMLCGNLPFNGKNDYEIMQNIQTQKLQFPEKEWSKISKTAKKFVKLLLKKNPEERPTSEEAFQNKWVQGRTSTNAPNKPILVSSLRNLTRFRSNIKIKQFAFEFITAHMTSQSEIDNLQNVFMTLDADGDGQLSREELIAGAEILDLPLKFDVEAILKNCDLDGNGFINYNEFLTASIDWKTSLTRKKLEATFSAFDLDGNGVIDLEELRRMFGSGEIDDNILLEVMNQADKNGDGVIDIKEFEEAIVRRGTIGTGSIVLD